MWIPYPIAFIPIRHNAGGFHPRSHFQCIANWQYGAMRAVAKNNYSSIRLLVVYEKHANVVYFDGIQLFKEEFGHSYVYDADGNVTNPAGRVIATKLTNTIATNMSWLFKKK